MKFTNVTKDDLGGYHFGIDANEDEVNFLVSLAVGILIDAGAVNMQAGTSQEIELPTTEEIADIAPSYVPGDPEGTLQ